MFVGLTIMNTNNYKQTINTKLTIQFSDHSLSLTQVYIGTCITHLLSHQYEYFKCTPLTSNAFCNKYDI